MNWYWWRSQRGILVRVTAIREHAFVWTRIYGLQLGPWFIGSIRGVEVETTVETEA